jgi:hypothetical protein
MGFFDRELGDVAKEVTRRVDGTYVPPPKKPNKHRKEDKDVASNYDNGGKIPYGRIIICFVVGLIVCMFALPAYNVWWMSMEGKAQLKKAEQDRQIMVQEAQATFDSSSLLADAAVVKAKGEAQAAIERAKGEAKARVENANGEAEANQVISASINFDYNIYLWIKALNNGRNSVVYVATEAGVPLPVTEAGKRPDAESPQIIPTVKVQENK